MPPLCTVNWSKALRSVRTAGQRYAALAAEAAPPWEHFQRVSAIAETARGRGENNYKMTLNAYVLAARLEQVALPPRSGSGP